jgi:hypothetical protein
MRASFSNQSNGFSQNSGGGLRRDPGQCLINLWAFTIKGASLVHHGTRLLANVDSVSAHRSRCRVIVLDMAAMQ